MAYTVKKLAELSGVSVRTLHFYDEIGLLKPAYHGSNGYRFYEEAQLLVLQQILFFRELGFELKQIQKVLGKKEFDQIAALNSHRKSLMQESEKISQLLKTIDKTIKHLKGKKKMKDQEIFDGFHIALVTKAKKGQSYCAAEEIVARSVKTPTKSRDDVEKRGKAYYDNLNREAHVIFRDLAHCIEKRQSPDADAVQRILKKHHALLEKVQNATQEVYLAMAELYRDHPEFRKQLDPVHPKLAEFMAEGMKVFAERELS